MVSISLFWLVCLVIGYGVFTWFVGYNMALKLHQQYVRKFHERIVARAANGGIK